MQKVPYFMSDPEWYYYDPKDAEFGYKLTEKAPKKAVDSYEEFYQIGKHASDDVDY